jgi:predicted DNA-binding transcriptional regulator YafY
VQNDHLVDPYGLVARAGVWYLVCGRKGRVRIHRVSALVDVRLSDECFERPADFDLGAFWGEWCAELEESRSDYVVTVRVAPDFVPLLPRYFGEQVRARIAQAGPPDAEGWITLELPFDRLESARDRILSFGRGVAVLEPRALRTSILDYANQIVALYDAKSPDNSAK